MNIAALELVCYESPTGFCHSEMFYDPSWFEIECAIRKLDRCVYRFVFLHRQIPALVPDLQVSGGRGEYSIEAFQPDQTWLSYVEIERSSREVDTWVSDQGDTRPEFLSCPDLAHALAAVRYFCEIGSLNPEMRWINPS